MRGWFFLIGFLSLFSASAFGGISGTVVREDGQPAAGARVAAFALESSEQQRGRWLSADPTRNALATAVAGAEGNFVLDVKAAVVDLRFDVAGQPAIGVRAAANEDVGVVRIAAHPMTRGTVTANGKPLAGATVIILFAGAESIATTDAGGHYAVPDPKRLPSRVLVQHARYAPVARELGPLMSQSADVSMSAGTVLTGRVVADAPVAKAIIEIDNLPLATTGADGTFAIEHVPAGARKLVARTDDRIAARQLGRERDLVLRLSKAVTVAGSVRDLKSGAPVSGVEVTAAPPHFGDTEHGVWVITDVKGNYAIHGLAGGETELTANHPGYGTPRITLNLPEGREARKVLYVSPVARISGAVVDERSRPIAGVSVTARPMGGGDALWTPGLLRTVHAGITGPNGRFLLRTADEDSVRIDATKAGLPPAHSAALHVAPGGRVAGVTITMPQGVVLRGRVTGNEAKPLPGARVSVAGDLVRTKDDGTFALRVLEGTYDVAVAAAGYAPRSVRAQVSADSRPLEIALEPGVAVSGRVTRGGEPVEGVNVYTVGGSPGEPVQTASDGTFRIDDLARGEIRLAFRKPSDFIQITRSVTAPASGVNVELPAGSRVSGRVIDRATGRPVNAFDAGLAISRPGAAIMLVAPVMRSFTSDDGAFAIDGVPAATHILAVTAPGYVMARVPNVTVEKGKNVDGVEVALDAGVRVHGHVTATDGAPLGGVLVRVDPALATHGAAMNDPYTLTDPDGEYVLDNLEQGDTLLAFSRTGLLTVRKNVTLSGTSAQIDAQLSSGVSITGVVLLEGGAAVANAQVQARSAADAGSVRATQTDDSGAFAIATVAPGHYEISATKPGYSEATLRDVDIPSAAALRLVMKGGGTITGRLLGLTPAELRGAAVQMSSSDGGGAPVSPDDSGRYRIDGAPPGTVRLSARSGQFTTSSRTAQTKSVQVESGATVTVDFDFTAGIVVSGRVTRNGLPQPDAVVSFLSPTTTQRSAQAPADANGRYEIGGIDEGTYNVTVVDRTNVPYSTTYQVSGSSTFDIAIDGAAVSGHVTDVSSGTAIAGAAVELRRTEAAGPDLRSAVSDAAGVFSFEQVPAGSYEARAQKPGYGAAAVPVTVAGSGAPSIEVRLTPSSGLRLRVVDARDQRPLAAWVHAQSDSGEGYDGTAAASTEPATIALAAGSYRLTAGASGYAPVSLTVTVPGEQTVALTPGGTIVVSSSSDAFAFVRIIDSAGLPLRFGPGTSAELFRVDPAPGQTRIANIPAGTYALQLIAGGNVLRSVTVTVREGESVAAKL
ncbi:MAG TPA: carboxypeptidase regulatory-like domain-containing protein [Thermoanaerobaculia bacterium]|jgi:hypothetical protein|nr:carboxypeptidase regulatory-like domain-containing protein [Thermoanaerobaculia bacterium]